MNDSRLSLRKDTLAELAPADLRQVAGGDSTPTYRCTDFVAIGPVPTLNGCLLTGAYPTLDCV